MTKFIFKNYEYDNAGSVAKFYYGFDNGYQFTEEVKFASDGRQYDADLLNKALFLSFILIGTSYYKTFPTTSVEIGYEIDDWQAKFFSTVYQEGLGQFAFENELRRENLAVFLPTSPISDRPLAYSGDGVLALQSGGKDSLLTATLLSENGISYTPWYVSSSEVYPDVINKLGIAPAICIRKIDRDNLQKAASNGAKNGHVPITYIIQSLAVVQAILLGKKQIVTSIAHEGEEPHAKIGDMIITHQWSKTWEAEQKFAEYVNRYISSDIQIGSPIRGLSELRVAELFYQHCWDKYSNDFSSCNVGNYQQGADNRKLLWCGECPKCANSYLLFAPFVKPDALKRIFNGKDLFVEPALEFTFKGLLGIDSIQKPFECVGQIDELRYAYHAAIKNGYSELSFDVPASDFNYLQTYPAQEWAEKMLQ